MVSSDSEAGVFDFSSKSVASDEEKQVTFRSLFSELVEVLGGDGVTMGRMGSNVLTAQKAT